MNYLRNLAQRAAALPTPITARAGAIMQALPPPPPALIAPLVTTAPVAAPTFSPPAPDAPAPIAPPIPDAPVPVAPPLAAIAPPIPNAPVPVAPPAPTPPASAAESTHRSVIPPLLVPRQPSAGAAESEPLRHPSTSLGGATQDKAPRPAMPESRGAVPLPPVGPAENPPPAHLRPAERIDAPAPPSALTDRPPRSEPALALEQLPVAQPRVTPTPARAVVAPPARAPETAPVLGPRTEPPAAISPPAAMTEAEGAARPLQPPQINHAPSLIPAARPEPSRSLPTVSAAPRPPTEVAPAPIDIPPPIVKRSVEVRIGSVELRVQRPTPAEPRTPAPNPAPPARGLEEYARRRGYRGDDL